MIYLILEIEAFEQQCVTLKGLFQSDRLKQHMVTIRIDPFLGNCAMYEHRCMEKINKLYKSAVKFDDRLQFKSIIEASMVSTPDMFIDNSQISLGPPMIVKKCSAQKSLRLFTEVLYVKNKPSVRRVGAAKSRHKEIRAGSMLWSSIPKRKGHKKINEQVKISIYNWILQYTQVV